MISIIIIVKNDRKIENLLSKLEVIPKPEEIEIIVIDSSEGSLNYIKEKFSCVNWVYYKNNTSKKLVYRNKEIWV